MKKVILTGQFEGSRSNLRPSINANRKNKILRKIKFYLKRKRILG
jgi:hypothetical protein